MCVFSFLVAAGFEPMYFSLGSEHLIHYLDPLKIIEFVSQSIDIQCPKLRVHPAPDVHISTAGCTILGGVHPVCARFLSNLLLLCIGRVHGAISGCTVLWEVHPASAQNKSLISDTDI